MDPMTNGDMDRIPGHKYDSIEYDLCKESADYLLSRTRLRPSIGIICGTGLAEIGQLLADPDIIPYSDIPNFPLSTVPAHKSRCLFGKMSTVEVFIMQGRFHLYDGYDIGQCAMPVRMMKLMGIDRLIITNAAGGLNPDYRVGDIMIIKDHVNLMGLIGVNPLVGKEDHRFGPRFFAMNDAYSPRWRQESRKAAAELDISHLVKEGVYIMVGGPNFETPAELRMLRTCGVDAVGMSTVHEALTAHHCGMSVFAFSLITNVCVVDYEDDSHPSVQEVLDTANTRSNHLKEFVAKMLVAMADGRG